MSAAREPIDLEDGGHPDLGQLVAEVEATRRPREVARRGRVVAVLMPVAPPAPAPRRRRGAALDRLRASYGAVPPRARPEDFRALREAFEEGVAEELAASRTL
jgi:antitoxin (DNA-binding transcriptional repressor) of toxin-antitoxin stability system